MRRANLLSMTDEFLTSVLGPSGAKALSKALDRSPQLAHALVPRTILSWVGLACRLGYSGTVPGTDVQVSFTKSTAGYDGTVDDFSLQSASIYQLSSALALALGVRPSEAPKQLKDLDLARLGKSIDLLVKYNTVRTHRMVKTEPKAGFAGALEPNKPIAQGSQEAAAPEKPKLTIAKLNKPLPIKTVGMPTATPDKKTP